MIDAAVLGAGPHGLSASAFLREAGLDVRTLGEPMGFWRRHMPRGMLLRSSKRSSDLPAPGRAGGIAVYERETRIAVPEPIPIERFLDYADWYRDRFVPEVDERLVSRVESRPGGFALVLADGDELGARRVVVAAGVAPFALRPPELEGLPPERVSHSLDHADLGIYRGRHVLVVGAGQSALESAALLREGGAEVELVARGAALAWIGAPRDARSPMRRVLHAVSQAPTEVGPRGPNWVAAAPGVYRRLPPRLRDTVRVDCLRPMGAYWLRARLDGVPVVPGRRVASAAEVDGALDVRLDDGSVRRVDHLLLATGYRVDVSRYPFLPSELLAGLRVRDGHPLLGEGLESSVPGLHFVGAPAALSYGPVMRFVTGAWFSSAALARSLAGRAPRVLAFAF
jgi:hypothetical protein